jgi:hypothetical protein
VDFVRALADPSRWPVEIGDPRDRLERRATDHWVHKTTKKQPLSVSTDRIAYPAMRAAGLLAHCIRAHGEVVDRTGANGRICEAYPDPAIRRFELWPANAKPRDSYKGSAQDIRRGIVGLLRSEAPWLRLHPSHQDLCVALDDCLDALLCALVARATERDMTIPPPRELAEQAATEGWIHIPRHGCLSELP